MTWTAFLWLGLLVAFLVAESTTVTLIALWFAAGSLAAMIAALLGAHIGLQVGIFVVVSAALLAARSTRSGMGTS